MKLEDAEEQAWDGSMRFVFRHRTAFREAGNTDHVMVGKTIGVPEWRVTNPGHNLNVKLSSTNPSYFEVLGCPYDASQFPPDTVIEVQVKVMFSEETLEFIRNAEGTGQQWRRKGKST